VSSGPVTLDMSTAQPIAAPVKLDMSTAQPIAPAKTYQSGQDSHGSYTTPKDAVNEVADMLGESIKSLAKVSGPNVVYEMLRQNFPQLDLKPALGMPTANEAGASGVAMLAGGEEGTPDIPQAAEGTPRPAVAPSAAAKVGSVLEHPAVAPWVDMMKRELMKVPGTDFAKTVYQSAKGAIETPEAPPVPVTAPPVPTTNGVPWGSRIPPQGPPELWGKPIPPEPPAATPTPEGTQPAVATGPQPPSARYLSGDSALRQVLTGQDNANLLKIAKSRGLNVARESVLKPGQADPLLINKIVNDFSQDELDDIADKYDTSKRSRHQFGDIGPEAWKTLSMQTYFPDVKIPATTLSRTTKAISGAAADSGDLTDLLKQSLQQVQAAP